ncbi:membrane protein DedA with SNARE-associated domain [Sphingomonas sp. PP-CE-3A-406]|uniref:DedA family protein n=1 Tax=Sphingomonas sp. PP-CE-3A-406 TaxID=2135659 RepID=UPI000EFA2F69|nr:DedA family protein [Sphingomonas sp. PP-CE-3A-406]RMB51998.1 membrane protein DedA with SNARE-associated domain [Sphingomonas sp. PP-CE-3A-406]
MSIESFISQYGLAAIFLGAAFEGETSVVTGGLLAHQHLLPLVGSAVAAVTGSFFADQLFFFAGRHYRDTKRVRRIAEKPAFAKALDTLDRHPTIFILGFRFLYGLRTISPIAIGTSHIPARTFVVLNAISALVWGVVFTAIGYVFGDGLIELVDKVMPKQKLVGVAILVAVAALVIAAIRFWRGRHARKAAPQPTVSPDRSR